MTHTILYKNGELEVSRDENGNFRIIGSQVQLIRELATSRASYRELHRKALESVDRVFQQCSENPEPILPDFLMSGDDKFEGVVKLAEAYVRLRGVMLEVKKAIQASDGYVKSSATLAGECEAYREALRDKGKK